MSYYLGPFPCCCADPASVRCLDPRLVWIGMGLAGRRQQFPVGREQAEERLRGRGELRPEREIGRIFVGGERGRERRDPSRDPWFAAHFRTQDCAA